MAYKSSIKKENKCGENVPMRPPTTAPYTSTRFRKGDRVQKLNGSHVGEYGVITEIFEREGKIIVTLDNGEKANKQSWANYAPASGVIGGR
jgi:ribosomal protein S4E